MYQTRPKQRKTEWSSTIRADGGVAADKEIQVKFNLAIKTLTERLRSVWDELLSADFNTEWMKNPRQVATDLLNWMNLSEPNEGDLQSLFDLVTEGRFQAWACPIKGCGERVYEGDPKDWGPFQGVCQVDYVSYPGTPKNHLCCDHCRMYQKIPA